MSLTQPRALTDNATDTVRGITLVAAAYLIWTLGDAGAKWVLPTVGAAQAMIWRGVFGGGAVLVFAAGRGAQPLWRRLIPVRWKLVLLRSAISSVVSIIWFVAWTQMSLIDSYAVGFTAPLMMTLLAIPMLGERIRWRRALSTVIGFLGVLVMLRPDGDLWKPITVVLLVGVAAMSVTRIMTRQLSTTETPECQAFWLLAGCIVSGVLTLPWFPATGPIDLETWLILAIFGVANGSAHCVYTRAYGLAPVSALASYEYTMLLWGGILGFVVFHELPSWNTLAGAAIIAGAGLYNLHRERVRARNG